MVNNKKLLTGGAMNTGILRLAVFAVAGSLFFFSMQCSKNPTGPNQPPKILSLVATPDTVLAPAYTMIVCTAVDPDNDPLIYNWTYSGGSIAGNGGDTVYYQPAPCCSGPQNIKCVVDDGKGGTASDVVVVIINPISQ